MTPISLRQTCAAGRPPLPEAEADPMESAILTLALCVYFAMYGAEGVFRWLLNMVGLDALIFLRDAVIFGAMGLIVARQLMNRRGEPVAIGLVALLFLHGLIGYSNLKGLQPVVAGAKPFLSLLIGAYCASRLYGRRPKLVAFLAVLWAVSFVAAGLEKYVLDWPWLGLKAEIAGQTVEVSRDWQVGAADKRAAGLARSSIHLSGLMSCFGIILFFAARQTWLRGAIALLTIVAVYWSTQKGALAAVILVFLVSLAPRRVVVPGLKWALIFVTLLMIGLPLILPGYVMPSGESGVFSLQSFYDRAQRMWPDAWQWHDQRATPFFGVGLGGIGYAMRFYSPEAAFYAADFAAYEPYYLNAADNMFIYLYVQFGVMSLLYIGLVLFAAMRLPKAYADDNAAALATLVFCFGYGIAVNIIEDQMGCMFLGAAAFYACRKAYSTAPAAMAAPAPARPRSAAPHDPYAVPFVVRERFRGRA